MLLAAGAFVLAATLASLVWSAVQAAIQPTFEIAPDIQWVPGLLINVCLNFIAFTLVYRFVPRVGIRWGEALRGATLAAILWEVGRQLLGIYLDPPWLSDGLRRDRLVHRDHALGILCDDRRVRRRGVYARRPRGKLGRKSTPSR